MDLVAERKHRHELRRAAKRKRRRLAHPPQPGLPLVGADVGKQGEQRVGSRDGVPARQVALDLDQPLGLVTQLLGVDAVGARARTGDRARRRGDRSPR